MNQMTKIKKSWSYFLQNSTFLYILDLGNIVSNYEKSKQPSSVVIFRKMAILEHNRNYTKQ